jgi:hypothetical protein
MLDCPGLAAYHGSRMTPANFESTRIEAFIKELGEEELRYLNRLVFERLKLIAQDKSTRAMGRFNIGEKVEFADNAGVRKNGTIIKLNKKTATVLTVDRQRWNVAPALLRPAAGK